MIGRILTIGGATVECPLIAPRRNGTRCVATTGNGCVFAKLHKIPSQIDVVSGTCHRRKCGEMKEQCLLYPQKGTAHCILGGRL